jgi:hypothetical protein
MKKLLLLSAAITTITCLGQQPIDVSEQTIKIGKMKTEEIYFGFADGDKIIFNFLEKDGKELKELEIIEWPGQSRFADFKTSKIENKTINITNTGIYKFRFQNGSLTNRICSIKIQRIPSSEATRNFNTTVYWGMKHDTSYYVEQERYLVKQELVPKIIIPTTDSYVNSGSNATFKGGKSRITFPVQIPSNTIEWYYQFSAFRDKEQVIKTKSAFNLAGQLSRLIDQTGGIKFGIDLLTQPPGADYCDVYLMDFNNSLQFEAKYQYQYYPIGSRENIKSGIVKMQGNAGGNFVIGIKNPDSGIGINVLLQCVAIVLEEEWGTREVKKFTVVSKEIPYLKS